MKMHFTLNTRTLVISAFAFLLIGVVVDLGITRPQIRKFERLSREKEKLLNEVNNVLHTEQESRGLISFLKSQNLEETLQVKQNRTATIYLGELIESSSLTRIELRSTQSSEMENLARKEFLVRVSGGYEPTVNFVRALEEGSRLVTIEEIKIGSSSDTNSLETRVLLSVYDAL